VLAGGIAKALTIEIKVAAPEGKLAKAGLSVINPPYGFAAEMRAVAGLLMPRLAAQVTLTWLAGSE